MLLNSFIPTQSQKQIYVFEFIHSDSKPETTAEKQNVHKTRARKNMATKINGNSKRQQMNNKPIVDSFHTNSYNNKKTITKE